MTFINNFNSCYDKTSYKMPSHFKRNFTEVFLPINRIHKLLSFFIKYKIYWLKQNPDSS